MSLNLIGGEADAAAVNIQAANGGINMSTHAASGAAITTNSVADVIQWWNYDSW